MVTLLDVSAPRSVLTAVGRRFNDRDHAVDITGLRFSWGTSSAPVLDISGLQIDRGILVDEYLNAGFDGVYAAGDCAQVYHPGLKDYWVSIGFGNAESMGRIAALNLLGGMEKAKAESADIFSDRGVLANTSWWMEL